MPGWGHQLSAESVLAEMSTAGFTYTELGSLGYLPTDSDELQATLARHNLSLLGGFIPLVLHDPAQAQTARDIATQASALIASVGGRFFATCVIHDPNDWRPAPLADHQWSVVAETLADVDQIATDHGLTQALHPHFDSLVETDAETQRMLEISDTALVLDTAHLLLGGGGALEIAQRHLDRIALVHLKDVNLEVAVKVMERELSLMAGVQNGLFPPLGQGGVPIDEIIGLLERSGRYLWYVLEQDAAIAEGDPSAIARLRLNAYQSIEFLRTLEPVLTGAGVSYQTNSHRSNA